MQNFQDLDKNQNEFLQIFEEYIKYRDIDKFTTQMNENIKRGRQIMG